jgi:predicted RNA-binding Zn-ribbon protein involved in translation (DUF1610 family)
MSKVHMKCPHCGMKMVPGYLRASGDKVYIQSEQSLEDSSLQALICPDCGYVELQATCPEALAQHHFSDEELGDEFSEEEES